MLHTLSTSLLPAMMIIAALSDVSTLRIPNWLTGLTAALFFPMAYVTGMPLVEFGLHLLAGVILFFAGYALFAGGLFGGGDAKLMAAAGLWFGTSQTVSFLVLTAVAGGVLAATFALWSVVMVFWEIHGPMAEASFAQKLKKLSPKVPYGFALAVGAILAFPKTWWVGVA